ncbi:MAG TPA: alanine--glyoxylate aminotransferase family protein [bacterium]|nr:alanine--glyoxylate aminotransferase family protein [bacterium]
MSPRADLKPRLYSPGPTEVPPYVLQALGSPITHHRSPVFSEYLMEVSENLKYVVRTEQDVYMVLASATGTMEASVSNLLSPGDKAICVRGGKFGERWSEICTAYGVEAINIDVEWGYAVDPAVIADTLKKNPDVKAVYTTLSETSTGIVTDARAVAEVIGKTDAVMVIDATSSLGATPLLTDQWGVDVVVGGGHKALTIPPGLAFISLSEKAWKLAANSKCPKYYLDLKKYRSSLAKQTTPFTPGVNLIMGLRESLKAFREEGYNRTMRRHEILGEAMRAGVKAMGLEIYPKAPFNGLTAILAPDGMDAGEIVKTLRNKYGITIAGGQDSLKGKIFRFAHMGYADRMDVPFMLAATEMVLADLGRPVAEAGKGVGAAMEILNREWPKLASITD